MGNRNRMWMIPSILGVIVILVGFYFLFINILAPVAVAGKNASETTASTQATRTVDMDILVYFSDVNADGTTTRSIFFDHGLQENLLPDYDNKDQEVVVTGRNGDLRQEFVTALRKLGYKKITQQNTKAINPN
ncbi:MAG: hypothetical protein J6U54_14110 [Clostridiales bacterium]|nr:hypothetical protein [Clostridiales bacterium]